MPSSGELRLRTLILALIALVTIGVLQVLGVTLSGVLNKVSTNMSAVSNP